MVSLVVVVEDGEETYLGRHVPVPLVAAVGDLPALLVGVDDAAVLHQAALHDDACAAGVDERACAHLLRLF